MDKSKGESRGKASGALKHTVHVEVASFRNEGQRICASEYVKPVSKYVTLQKACPNQMRHADTFRVLGWGVLNENAIYCSLS